MLHASLGLSPKAVTYTLSVSVLNLLTPKTFHLYENTLVDALLVAASRRVDGRHGVSVCGLGVAKDVYLLL